MKITVEMCEKEFLEFIEFIESRRNQKSLIDDWARITALDSIEMTVRTRACLRSAGINTVRDLLGMTEIDLLKTPNFGKRSLNEVKAILSDLGGLSLASSHNYPAKPQPGQTGAGCVTGT